MTIRTITDLTVLAAQTTPISQAVKNFYANNIALGTKQPCNQFRSADFFGTAAGIPGTAVTLATVEILNRRISDGILSTLAQIYLVMKNVVSGTYGNPVTGPVSIPSGLPGAGTYNEIPPPGEVSAAEQAFQVLIPLAESAISAAATAMGNDTDVLNQGFVAVARGAVNESLNFTRAGVDFATLPSPSQISVLAFVTGIPGYAQNSGPGESAEVLTALANTATETGQAIVGALREGQNSQQLDSVGINRYNTIPTSD